MSNDRERGTMLRLLDPDRLSERALRHLAAMVPEVNWVNVRPDMRYATATSPEGVYVICTEGVGWEVTRDKPFALDVIAGWEKDGKVEGGMTASNRVYLSLWEVVQDTEGTEQVDLADFVRQFGSRLESNFWLWHRTLNPAPKRTRKAKK